jgi:hypothetical protein
VKSQLMQDKARVNSQEARILATAVSLFCRVHNLPFDQDPCLTTKQRSAVAAGSPSITLSTLNRLDALAAERGAPSLFFYIQQKRWRSR